MRHASRSCGRQGDTSAECPHLCSEANGYQAQNAHTRDAHRASKLKRRSGRRFAESAFFFSLKGTQATARPIRSYEPFKKAFSHEAASNRHSFRRLFGFIASLVRCPAVFHALVRWTRLERLIGALLPSEPRRATETTSDASST